MVGFWWVMLIWFGFMVPAGVIICIHFLPATIQCRLKKHRGHIHQTIEIYPDEDLKKVRCMGCQKVFLKSTYDFFSNYGAGPGR